MVWNVRQKQRDVLAKVLNLNSPNAAPGKDPSELYKVLVLDRFTKNIIAPLMRVSDLRKHGVTLHLMLEAERDPILDVPAVYLMQPTAANIDKVVADAAAGLYAAMHLNFTTSLPTRLLEQLATGIVKADAAQRVAKLFDQYLAFIALEPTLFSLGLPGAYVQLNDPTAQDTQIEAVVTSIVDGLFSMCVTLGVVPVIRCPKGGVAEHVASLLDAKLRDALRARNNLFSEGVTGLAASLTRPLLCLFDRNYDLAGALTHSWTYKPLVHDVLGLQLNRVSLPDSGTGHRPGQAGKSVSYDVDENDFFWEVCGAHVFPKVAEEVETQLKAYRTAVENITKASSHAGEDGVPYDPDELLRKNTQHLMAAVSSLPELQEQKATIDKHTNLATALLGAIKARGLDAWQSLEEDLLCGKADTGAVIKLLAGGKGNAADRLRLAIIWLLTLEAMPTEASYAEVEGALRSAGVDSSALAYARTLRRNNLVGPRPGQDGAGAAGAAAQGGGAALLDYVAKSVKTLLSGNRLPPVVAAVEALMDGKQGSPEHETFAVFDPKAQAGRSGSGPERAKGPFRDAIVFMIGGGNYLEREALLTWAAKAATASTTGGGVLGGSSAGASMPRHVLYGATELLSGEALTSQLADLGARSGLGPGKLTLDLLPNSTIIASGSGK